MRTAALLLVAGCASPPTEAEAYARALSSAPNYATARASCDHIADPSVRGDCQVTITERFARLDPADCDTVDGEVWQDECRFLMAERIGRTGDLDAALATCVTSRFRRHCAWHLLQDAAENTLHKPHAVAEQVLHGFMEVQALPDAPNQFWRIRWRELAGEGQTLDEAGCSGLLSEPGCRDALDRHVFDMLQVVARRDRAGICGKPAGQRVLHSGQPAWTLGPLTAAAEARWVTEHCSALAGQSAKQGDVRRGAAPTEESP
mgnify:CR=1 FL=1